MRKRFAILLYTLLFALLQLGVTVEVHHCGKRTSYSALGIEMGKQCPCPPEHHQHHKGCCHDEEVVLKADTDQVTVHSYYLANTDLIVLSAVPIIDFVTFVTIKNDSLPLITESPPGDPGKIFLQNRVFLI